MTQEKITEVFALAKSIGAKVTFTFDIPKTEELPKPGALTKEKATMRTVMWALNNLKAAPGQPNRELVRKFLFTNGWLGSADEPESWVLESVPISHSELAMIVARVNQFEQENK